MRLPWFRLMWVMAAASAVYGCAGSDRAGEKGLRSQDVKGMNAASKSASSTTPLEHDRESRPVALLGSEEITWEQTRPLLAEASGGIILEEIALERLLEREMRLRGLAVEAGSADAERDLLVQSLLSSAGVPPAQGAELLDKVRKSRGLGERRFAALLRRNAMLRRLVRDDVNVSPEDVRQAYEIRYGVKYRTRLILLKTDREAAAALGRLRPSGGGPEAPFSRVAEEASFDTSRLRGGLIGAVSPVDPSYPAGLRSAIERATIGEPTPVIALEQGYAIVLVEARVEPTGPPFESVSADLEREVRVVRERAEMDRLAARLLRGGGLTVLDPGLEWSWKAHSGQ